MAILAFQKPDKVVMLDSNDKFGKFEFRPLEPGFGVTIGNALRRILLSSLEGYAINTIKNNTPELVRFVHDAIVDKVMATYQEQTQ